MVMSEMTLSIIPRIMLYLLNLVLIVMRDTSFCLFLTIIKLTHNDVHEFLIETKCKSDISKSTSVTNGMSDISNSTSVR